MKLLIDMVEEVRLTKKDIEYLSEVMSNGTKFKEWTRDKNPDYITLAKAMKIELGLGRVRSDVFRHIVERYNRQFTDVNRATAYKLLGRKEVA